MISTAKIVVYGKNFAVLCEKLKRRNIKLIDSKLLAMDVWLITISHKDLQKTFDALKGLWKTEFVGLGGPVALLQKAKRYLFSIVCVLLFIVAALTFDGLILGVDVKGITGEKQAKIGKIAADEGASLFSTIEKIDTATIKQKVFTTVAGVDFVTIKKSGNRLVIDVICNENAKSENEESNMITAPKSGKLLRISVYSGTKTKEVGDYVTISETLVDGYYIDKNGSSVPVKPMASFLLECTYVKEYSNVGLDETDLYLKTLLDGKIDESSVTQYKVSPISVGNSAVYRVEITYLYRGDYSLG